MRRLITQRLVLRQWRDEDLEPFAALNADAAVMRYFPAALTREESDALAGAAREGIQNRGWGLWAVETQDVGTFIGFVGLAEPDFDAHFTPAVEVGWRLAREHWGRGYATEAARRALTFGFDELGLDEIVSFTAAVNDRSWRVMRRLKMTHDPADDFDHPSVEGGVLRRHVLYRISRRQWDARHPAAASQKPSSTEVMTRGAVASARSFVLWRLARGNDPPDPAQSTRRRDRRSTTDERRGNLRLSLRDTAAFTPTQKSRRRRGAWSRFCSQPGPVVRRRPTRWLLCDRWSSPRAWAVASLAAVNSPAARVPGDQSPKYQGRAFVLSGTSAHRALSRLIACEAGERIGVPTLPGNSTNGFWDRRFADYRGHGTCGRDSVRGICAPG
jgi:RimJ/RimL family protein N-acetyltransferase